MLWRGGGGAGRGLWRWRASPSRSRPPTSPTRRCAAPPPPAAPPAARPRPFGVSCRRDPPGRASQGGVGVAPPRRRLAPPRAESTEGPALSPQPSALSPQPSALSPRRRPRRPAQKYARAIEARHVWHARDDQGGGGGGAHCPYSCSGHGNDAAEWCGADPIRAKATAAGAVRGPPSCGRWRRAAGGARAQRWSCR
jgi:hypothetical protein